MSGARDALAAKDLCPDRAPDAAPSCKPLPAPSLPPQEGRYRNESGLAARRTSQHWPSGSTQDFLGSTPMRAVPIWCAENMVKAFL